MHLKGVRRATFWVVLITASGMFVRHVRETRPPWAVQAWEQFSLPFRVAALQTKAPETHVAMPVSGVSSRQVSNTWHAARGADRQHEGQDIFAPRGTAVLSATEGVVTRIGTDRLGGNVVVVMGAGGRAYYYAHLNSYAAGLMTGQWVHPGTVLGFVGTTGNARGTPPHLHFGVYALGRAINPLPLLAD